MFAHIDTPLDTPLMRKPFDWQRTMKANDSFERPPALLKCAFGSFQLNFRCKHEGINSHRVNAIRSSHWLQCLKEKRKGSDDPLITQQDEIQSAYLPAIE